MVKGYNKKVKLTGLEQFCFSLGVRNSSFYLANFIVGRQLT